MMDPVGALFPGFEARVVTVRGVDIFARVGGAGPPLLLLHGYPETHAAWHRLAPRLQREFALVLPDLRGYGRSAIPASGAAHVAYSKRTMAVDAAGLMTALGHERFAVMGHDRGARVAYRLALEAPERVERLVVLGIMPTIDAWHLRQQGRGDLLDQWVFMAQPAPLPESLISHDPQAWVATRFARATRSGSADVVDPVALADYLRTFENPDRVHAVCEDYRAGARIDLDDDAEARHKGMTIGCPLLAAWGRYSPLGSVADPLAIWRRWAPGAAGQLMDFGHYLHEECPDELLAIVLPFLRAGHGGPK